MRIPFAQNRSISRIFYLFLFTVRLYFVHAPFSLFLPSYFHAASCILCLFTFRSQCSHHPEESRKMKRIYRMLPHLLDIRCFGIVLVSFISNAAVYYSHAIVNIYAHCQPIFYSLRIYNTCSSPVSLYISIFVAPPCVCIDLASCCLASPRLKALRTWRTISLFLVAYFRLSVSKSQTIVAVDTVGADRTCDRKDRSVFL